MAWPTVAVNTTNVDQTTDSPATARADLLDLIQKCNLMIAQVSSFMGGHLADTTAGAARTTLGAATAGALASSGITGAAPLASPTFTGTVTAPAFSGPLTGNVTGNVTGNATTATSASFATTQASTDNSTNVATTAMVQSAVVGGAGYVWQNLLASRALGTNYTNSTGKPIAVFVSAAGNNTSTPGRIQAVSGGVVLGEAWTSDGVSVWNAARGNTSFIVPNGSIYSVSEVGGGSSLISWAELR